MIKFQGSEGKLLKAVGLAYIAVAVLGFFTSGNMLLGVVHINEPDRWLHLGLAVMILAAGFLAGERNLTAAVH